MNTIFRRAALCLGALALSAPAFAAEDCDPVTSHQRLKGTVTVTIVSHPAPSCAWRPIGNDTDRPRIMRMLAPGCVQGRDEEGNWVFSAADWAPGDDPIRRKKVFEALQEAWGETIRVKVNGAIVHYADMQPTCAQIQARLEAAQERRSAALRQAGADMRQTVETLPWRTTTDTPGTEATAPNEPQGAPVYLPEDHPLCRYNTGNPRCAPKNTWPW